MIQSPSNISKSTKYYHAILQEREHTLMKIVKLKTGVENASGFVVLNIN